MQYENCYAREHVYAHVQELADARVMCADAVVVPGVTGFVIAQHAIAALQFMPLLSSMKPGKGMGDPAGCVKGGFTNKSLKTLLLRQIRCGLASHPLPALIQHRRVCLCN